MKKRLLPLLLLLLCLLTGLASAEMVLKPVAIKSLSLSPNKLTLYVGETGAIAPQIKPSTATNQVLTWTSSNEQVAAVDSEGNVTGIGAGKATITAATQDGSKRKASCKVTVQETVTAISLNETALSLNKGATKVLKVTGTPSSASLPSVSWTSSDTAVATVGKSGKVTAKDAGTATISATVVTKAGTTLTAECPVTVTVPITKLELEHYSVSMGVGDTQAMPKITITPAMPTSAGLTYTSSNEQVVTVSSDGVLTATGIGTATVVTTPTDSSSKARCTLTVNVVQPVTSIQLADSLRLTVDQLITLEATALPADATNKKKEWSSSDTSVVTVAYTGMVKAVGVGTAVITCAATDGSGTKAECTVTVYQPVTSLSSSSGTKLVLTQGVTRTLPISVSPKNATDKSLTWTTTDAAVATVDDNNVVTAVAPGSCTVRCATNDGSDRSLSFSIIVEPKQSVSITAIRRVASYGGDVNCLFVTPVNNCSSRTVQAFSFQVFIQNEAGETEHIYSCEWDKSFSIIKPGATGDSGYWHWYNLENLMFSPQVGLTVTSVTFTDGTRQNISEADRVTVWLQ